MCGLAGFFETGSRAIRPEAAALAARQIATIRYRGPDAAQIHVGPGFALAHARLSIIDTSASANQPMHDATGAVSVVFNGEIYNFAELRAELEAAGHQFRTRSDTEVIVEGYRRWGPAVARRLRGMFAIALYDAAADRLILIRDRIGKKPLCYGWSGKTFVFGSELKAVLAFPGVPREADIAAIDAFLTYQVVPGDMCAFRGLSRVPPAHIAVVERSGKLTLERYWSLPEPAAITRPAPEADLAAELRHRLAEATRIRLVSDVPLGAFLSGGVDSSAVVAMMAAASSEPVRTFTIGFDAASHDERRFARQVADRYGTRHEELEVKADAAAILDDLAYHYDEPFADSSAVPTYYVSKIARERVTVALSGDGGDESFLGYERYGALSRLGRLQSLPRPARAALSALFAALPASADRNQLLRRLRRATATLREPPHRLYAPFMATFDDAQKRALYAGDLTPHLARSAIDRLEPFFAAAPTLAHGAAWADAHTYLPDDILVKVDIASMACSLETRAPFLDHELMEWAAGLPADARAPGGEPKGLLKRALEPLLPRELLYRPKMGFAAPIDAWFSGPLAERLDDALLSPRARARGLFDPTGLETLLTRHRRGESQGYRLWALMMLELWHRQWIDPADPFDTPAAQRVMERYAVDLTSISS